MHIDRSHVMAVAIDIQERLMPHIFRNAELTPRIVALIKGLRILGVPIMVTEQYSKGLGHTIPPVAEALGEFRPLEKMTFSACGHPDIQGAVLGSQGHYVICFGIEAHICVLQTVLDIKAQGRQPILVHDAVSSRHEFDIQVAVNRMRHHGVIVTTVESLLFEILGSANAPEFKQISEIVKALT
ncbi:MAG: isochorismatase family protein [Bradyrhizobiaceae bacterium]|nr:isochorismatase family protein [Bradyrhizobiaceae bacterium]